MLEFILVGLIILVAGFILAMLTSVFMAYVTQANYVDETYDDHDD
jgi:hypothetical protein